MNWTAFAITLGSIPAIIVLAWLCGRLLDFVEFRFGLGAAASLAAFFLTVAVALFAGMVA